MATRLYPNLPDKENSLIEYYQLLEEFAGVPEGTAVRYRALLQEEPDAEAVEDYYEYNSLYDAWHDRLAEDKDVYAMYTFELYGFGRLMHPDRSLGYSGSTENPALIEELCVFNDVPHHLRDRCLRLGMYWV